MNLKLKDVGNMCSIKGITPIKSTKMWEQDVTTITPTQLFTFKARMKLDNQSDIGDTVIEAVLSELQRACAQGQIEFVEALRYSITKAPLLTLGELRKGLSQLSEPTQMAIMFGLEAKMSAEDVSFLTWARLNDMQQRDEVSELAQTIAFSRQRNLHSPYVFWHVENKKAYPVTGLEMEVFNAFDMVWGELAEAFRTLVMIDGERNALEFRALIAR
jgi:hypothetical protein